MMMCINYYYYFPGSEKVNIIVELSHNPMLFVARAKATLL